MKHPLDSKSVDGVLGGEGESKQPVDRKHSGQSPAHLVKLGKGYKHTVILRWSRGVRMVFAWPAHVLGDVKSYGDVKSDGTCPVRWENHLT